METETLSQMCNKCFETKKLTEFVKDKNKVNGFRSTCKRCMNTTKRTKYPRFPLEKIRESITNKAKLEGKNFIILKDLGIKKENNQCRRFFLIKCDCGIEKTLQHSHIEPHISCGSSKCPYSIYAKQKLNSIIAESQGNGFLINKTTWNTYITGAKQRNLEFNIQPADVLELWNTQNGCCNKTGRRLLVGLEGKTAKNLTWSINRIDSTKGYIKGNIELVHKFCNIIQNKFSDKALDTFCMARAVQILKNNPEYGKELKDLLKNDIQQPEVIDDIWKEANKHKSESKFKGIARNKLYTDRELEEPDF